MGQSAKHRPCHWLWVRSSSSYRCDFGSHELRGPGPRLVNAAELRGGLFEACILALQCGHVPSGVGPVHAIYMPDHAGSCQHPHYPCVCDGLNSIASSNRRRWARAESCWLCPKGSPARGGHAAWRSPSFRHAVIPGRLLRAVGWLKADFWLDLLRCPPRLPASGRRRPGDPRGIPRANVACSAALSSLSPMRQVISACGLLPLERSTMSVASVSASFGVRPTQRLRAAVATQTQY